MDHGLLFRTNIPLSWNIYGFLFRCWLGRWHPWYFFWLSGNILDRNPYFAITSYSMVIPLFGVQRNRVLFLDEVEKLNFELLPIVCVKSCELNHFSNKLDFICPQLLLHRVTIQVLLPIKESLKNETCWDLSILYQGENSFWRTYYQFCSRDWTSCWYTNKPLKEKKHLFPTERNWVYSLLKNYMSVSFVSIGPGMNVIFSVIYGICWYTEWATTGLSYQYIFVQSHITMSHISVFTRRTCYCFVLYWLLATSLSSI